MNMLGEQKRTEVDFWVTAPWLGSTCMWQPRSSYVGRKRARHCSADRMPTSSHLSTFLPSKHFSLHNFAPTLPDLHSEISQHATTSARPQVHNRIHGAWKVGYVVTHVRAINLSHAALLLRMHADTAQKTRKRTARLPPLRPVSPSRAAASLTTRRRIAMCVRPHPAPMCPHGTHAKAAY